MPSLKDKLVALEEERLKGIKREEQKNKLASKPKKVAKAKLNSKKK